MEEILVALLSNAVFRMTVEEIAVKIFAEIFHRRSTDPDFLNKSDQVFKQLQEAQGDDQKQLAAHQALQGLMALPSA